MSPRAPRCAADTGARRACGGRCRRHAEQPSGPASRRGPRPGAACGGAQGLAGAGGRCRGAPGSSGSGSMCWRAAAGPSGRAASRRISPRTCGRASSWRRRCRSSTKAALRISRPRHGRWFTRGVPAARAGAPGPAATTTARSSRAGPKTIAARLRGSTDSTLRDCPTGWRAAPRKFRRGAGRASRWRDSSNSRRSTNVCWRRSPPPACVSPVGPRSPMPTTTPSLAPCARAGATPRDEVARALEWARVRALADPEATFAIAIEDLGTRRAEVRALADEILCPALQWPGHENDPRPYNLSLGDAASEVALIAAALDIIALAHAPLPIARAATLVRSPYLAAAETTGCGARHWSRRGCAKAGAKSRSPAWLPPQARTIAPSRRCSAPWTLVRRNRPRSPPRAWAEVWRTWVEAAGWPGNACCPPPNGRLAVSGTSCSPSSPRSVIVAPALQPRRSARGAGRACARQGVPAGVATRADPDSRRARSGGPVVRRACGWPGSPPKPGRRRRNRIRCCRSPGSASATFRDRAPRASSRMRKRWPTQWASAARRSRLFVRGDDGGPSAHDLVARAGGDDACRRRSAVRPRRSRSSSARRSTKRSPTTRRRRFPRNAPSGAAPACIAAQADCPVPRRLALSPARRPMAVAARRPLAVGARHPRARRAGRVLARCPRARDVDRVAATRSSCAASRPRWRLPPTASLRRDGAGCRRSSRQESRCGSRRPFGRGSTNSIGRVRRSR